MKGKIKELTPLNLQQSNAHVMSLVLIPEYVDTLLREHNRNLNDVLNPKVILSTLSVEDVSFYIYLNRHLDRFLDSQIVGSFNYGYYEALRFTEDQIKPLNPYIEGFDTTLKDKKEYSYLFGLFSDPVPSITFKVVLLNVDTIGLIPIKEGGSSVLGVVSDLLHHLNNRIPFPQLASQSIFKWFLTNV